LTAFRFESAIVRSPGRSVVSGLRQDERQVPTFEGVAREHHAYVAALQAAGLDIEVLPPLEPFPDAIFVEDPALTFAEGAILLRPGAPSRAGEASALAAVLERRFDRVVALPDGHTDGGDVLVMANRVTIGLSERTDPAGAKALVGLLAGFGRSAEIVVPPAGTLHLKSAAAVIDEETLLLTPGLAAAGLFRGLRALEVPAGEEAAANVLRINQTILVGDRYPRTIDLLSDRGLTVVALPVSEIAKLDAGFSCMSLRW
jgi:dimethylargininase